MAIRSDTNNRNLPDTIVEMKLEGEISGYDYSVGIPDLDTEYVEQELEGLEFEVSETEVRHREGVNILYREEDQERIYDLIP